MATPKIHKYSSHVTAAEIMPEHVRAQYQRERLSGTLCGYVSPNDQVVHVNTEVSCKLCLREIAKAN